jgi:hypothetical protein
MLLGAVLALGGTWFLLNYKWVAGGIGSFVQVKPEQEEKDEEDDKEDET